MVKPYKVFLLLIILISLLIAPSLLIPDEGIYIGRYHFLYPRFSYFVNLKNAKPELNNLAPQIAYLDKVIDSTDLAKIVADSSGIREPKADSVQKENSLIKSEPKPFTAEWLKSKIVKLEFPDSTRSSLDHFFEALRSGECQHRLIRIMHFGDSQIEGDRITSFLRNRFQNQFGGSGMGLLHVEPNGYQPLSVTQTVSYNWEKFTLNEKDHENTALARYSIMGGYSIFNQTSSIFSSKQGNEAWVEFKRTGKVNATARNFNRFKLLYGYNSKPFLLELKINDQTIDADLVASSNSINQISWDIPLSYKSFALNFKADESPLIFGVSLESNTGIAVDNIPLRGSSGIDFTKSDPTFIKDVLTLLNTKLIILQFGVNVVPNVVSSYKYYEDQLYKQLKLLQSAKPDASFIMVGVSDVSTKRGVNYISSPNIIKIRDAQRNAAFRAGIPFWDCFKAMGGENSMSAWVFANPPLANKDFIHFTGRGAMLIAEMFYSAIISEYNDYLNSFKQFQGSVKKDRDSLSFNVN